MVAFKRCTISRGVFFGAHSPTPLSKLEPGTPASSVVGREGSCAERLEEPRPSATSLPLRSGKLVALGLGSSKRSAQLPSLPTTEEAGVPGSSFDNGVGLWAPKKTPRDIVQRLNATIRRLVDNEPVKSKLESVGGEPWPMTPEQMDAHIAREYAELKKLIPRLGITPQ